MKQRVIGAETLDYAPDPVARRSLGDLERINRYLGGHRALISELARLEPPHSRFSVLDVGAATGDYARRITRRFRYARVVSLDCQARNLESAPHPRVLADAFALPFAAGSFDYVIANLLLHHFEDGRIEAMLKEFSRVARKAVIVNDLERHWIARAFLPATRAIFGWHPATVHDGVTSVRAGFLPGELDGLARRAGLRLLRSRRILPWFRIVLVLGILLTISCARRYHVEGLVLGVDREAGALTVAHRAVPGLMPAMTMPFRAARHRELQPLQPGARVSFRLDVGRGGSLASRIRVTDTRLADGGFRFPVPPERLSPGDAVADFTLTDMDGRLVRFSGLAGKLVAVNFIYTRCPLPDVCPRLAASFASLQRAFRDEMPSRLMLLSITLDPDFDVPDVLAGYARSARADPRCWRFLTGDVAPAARQFGVAYWVEEGLIAHSSATAIIGPDQRLRAIVEGSSFPLEQLAALIGFELDRMKK